MSEPLPSVSEAVALPSELHGALGFESTDEGLVIETADTVFVVNGETGDVLESIPLPQVPQINDTLLTADSLWVTDHDNGAVVRVDRATGEEVARVELPRGRAVSLLASPDGVWAGGAHEAPEFAALIDVATNEVTRVIEQGAFPMSDGESLWFGRDQYEGTGTVRRVDPDSGAVLASIRMDGAENCYLGGSFPDAVWSWCFDPWPEDTTAARLDLDAGDVEGEVPLGESGGLAHASDRHSWFWTDPGGDTVQLLRVANGSHALDRMYEMRRTTLVAFDAQWLWVIDTQRGELSRHALADL